MKDTVKDMDTKERIINSAMKEFSLNGFNGSRVENITKNANINKAMLFYYFDSKQNLYDIIIKKTATALMVKLNEVIHPELTIEEFLDKFPDIYIDFFSKNKYFINMLSIDLIQNPNHIADLIGKMFVEKFGDGPAPFETLVLKWYKEKKITEKDPIHFILNIMSLVIFPFIIKPIPEKIFKRKIDENEEYYDYRKKSIKNILKRGLLK